MLTKSQLKLLEDLRDFMEDQPGTRPYEEDEFKLSWADRVVERFIEERSK